MVEYFVHIDPADPPRDLVVVTVEVPDDVAKVALTPAQLPANWRQSPAPARLARIGDEFVREGEAGILTVPSVLAPAESNWLINPRHPQAGRIWANPPEPFHDY